MTAILAWEDKFVPGLRSQLIHDMPIPATIRDCEKIAITVLLMIKQHVELNNSYIDPLGYDNLETWLQGYWPEGVIYCAACIQEYGVSTAVDLIMNRVITIFEWKITQTSY